MTSARRLVGVGLLAVLLLSAGPAMAQATADPFATAVAKACAFQQGLQRLAASVGMVSMVICLMLGYFNKLNWRWVATCLGVSFSLSVVPTWVMSLAGGGC